MNRRVRFTTQQRVDMYDCFIECGSIARRAAVLYSERFPARPQVNHKTFIRVAHSMRRFGAVAGPSRHRQRNFDEELDILLYVLENPNSSLRNTGKVLGFSKDKIRNVLRTYNFKPYRSHLVQGLRDTDYDRRLMFLTHMSIWEAEENILPYILWTDESKFTTNGILNRWNFRTWAQENPRISYSCRHQVVHSINVWCGLLGNKLIGPYFYQNNLNGTQFLNFLRSELPTLLEDVPLRQRQRMILQLDGCPAHNSLKVRQYLNRHYRDRWIGPHGPICWPPRSPDLSPLDFFLWGHLKNSVYAHHNPAASVEELMQRVENACRSVSPESIALSTSEGWLRRANLCIFKEGRQFEHEM